MATQVASLLVQVDGNTAKLDKAVDDSVKRTKAKIDNSTKMTASQLARQNSQDSGTARGLGGLTGASARDFASQSQGLGGVVRLYATFAANLFAASAAFGALSRAADTTNMVKGLDQLGAASGRALGSLSKQLVAATDGAINLRDAMSATALASAGGMSDASILRLGNAAKQASLALGIAMPDAISRLSRGIVKLEPELLDEIGIMVRVDKVTADYAKSVGKSALAVTDFEKRQAFANAVLDQAEKKFGAIKIDANPYAKLLASMENLAQKGLELVNTVLTPIVGVLSSSPTALATAMALIASVLLKQAIPAIGMFRENARRMADEARDRVKSLVEDQRVAAEQMDIDASNAAAKSFRREESTTKKLQELQKARFNSKIVGKDLRNTLSSVSALDLTPDQLTSIKSKSDELLASEDAVYRKQGDKLKNHLDSIGKIRASSEAYIDNIVEKGIARDTKWYAHQELTARRLTQLNRAAAKRDLLVSVGETAAQFGPTAAFSKLTQETSKLDASKFSKFATVVQGSFSIATSAISTFLNAFGVWIAGIGIAVAAVQTLYNWVSTSREEMEKFNTSIDGLNSSAKNTSDTVNTILAKDGKNFFSAESILARANAFTGLADSIKASVASFDKLDIAKNAVEDFVDSIYGIFGKSDFQLLTKGVVKNISNSFSLLQDPTVKNEYSKAIRNLLGQEVDLTEIGITRALDSLSAPQRIGVLKELGNITKTIANNLGNASGTLTTFTGAVSTLDNSIKAVSTSLQATDPISKVGIAGLEAIQSLNKALANPQNSLQAVSDILNSPVTGLMSEDSINRLKKAKKVLEDMSTDAKTAQNAVAQYSSSNDKKVKDGFAAYRSLFANQRRLGESEVEKNNRLAKGAVDPELKSLSDASEAASKRLAKAQAEQSKLIQDAVKDTEGVFDSYITRAEKTAQALAKINVQRTKLNIDASYGANTFKEERKLIDQEAGIKLAEINARYDLTLATINSASRMEELTDAIIEKTNQEKLSASARKETILSPRQVDAIREEEAQIAKRRAERLVAGNSPAQRAVLAGRNAEIAGVIGSRNAARLSNADGDLKARNKYERDLLDTKAQSLELDKKAVELNQQYIVSYSSLGAETLYTLQSKTSQVKYDKDLNTLLEQQVGLSSTSDENAKVLVAKKIEQLKLEKGISDQTAKAAFIFADETKKLEEYVKLQSRSLEISKNINEIQNSFDSINTAILSHEKEMGTIDEASFIRKKALIDLNRLDRDAVESTNELEKQRSQLLGEVLVKRNAGFASGNYDIDGYEKEEAAINALFNAKKASADAELFSKKLILTLDSDRDAQQAEFNKQLSETVGLTESLTAVFGDLGTNIGNAVKGLLELSQTDIKYLKEKTRLEEVIANGDSNEKDTIENRKNLAKLEKKYANDQLSNIAQVANATKKSFKEETGAYKVLDGIEKAAHAYKMAVMIQENATKLGLLAREVIAAVTANGTIALSAVPGALLKFVQQLGWPGVAAGAAFVASLGLGSGGATGYSGPSVEDIQTNQNTGMSYIDGKYQENGSGVFGDASAKSESINKSLELIASTSVEGMSYSNRTVDLLTAIKDNTSQAATALYGVQGVRAGSALGTREGSSSNPGFLGAFGSSNSTTIDNTGIKLGGTFASAVVKGFETVTESRSNSGFFGIGASSSSETTDRAFALPTGVEESIRSVFTDAGKLLNTQGEKLGLDSKQVTDILNSFSLVGKEASLKGLSGEDLTNALNALISSSIDDVSKQLFPEISKFQKFGEGYLETVTRVIDTSEKVGQAFASIGSTNTADSLKTVTERISLELPDALANAAGGLSEFISLTEDFGAAFLSQEEQLLPKYKVLQAELSNLGYSADMTRTEFKNLITGFKVTDKASADMYVSLLKLAPAFDSVVGYVEELTGLTSNSLSDLLKEGFLGSLDSAELGKQLAKQIEEGIYNALADSFANQISSIFIDQVVNPMVTAILTGGALTEAVSTSTLENIVNTAKKSVEALSTIFQDPGFIAAMQAIKETVSSISLIGTQVANKPFTYEAKKEDTAKDPIKEEQEKLQAQLDKLRLDAMSKLKQREVERSKLLSEVARQTYDLIKVEEDLAESRKQLLDISRRIETATANAADAARAKESSRNRELETATDGLVAASLKYLYALEDVTDATNKVKAAQDDVTNKLTSLVATAKSIVSARDAALQENYATAVEKKKDAEKALNEYIKDSVKGIKDLTKDLGKFLKLLDTTDLGGGSKADQLLAARAQFEDALAKTRMGDKAAAESLPEVASKLLELSKETSSTAVDYQRDVATVRNAISGIIDLGETTADQLARNAGLTTDTVDEFATLTKNVADAIDDVSYWEKKAKEVGVVLEDADATAKTKYAKLEYEAAKVIEDMLKFANGLDPASKAQLESLWNSKVGLDDFATKVKDANEALAKLSGANADLSTAIAKASAAAEAAGSIFYKGGGKVIDQTTGVEVVTTPGSITQTDLVKLINDQLSKGASLESLINGAVTNYGANLDSILNTIVKAKITGYETIIKDANGTVTTNSKTITDAASTIKLDEIKTTTETAVSGLITSVNTVLTAVNTAISSATNSLATVVIPSGPSTPVTVLPTTPTLVTTPTTPNVLDKINYAGGGSVLNTLTGLLEQTSPGSITKSAARDIIDTLAGEGYSAKDIVNGAVKNYGAQASDIIEAGLLSKLNGFDTVTYAKGGSAAGAMAYTYDEVKTAMAAAIDQGATSEDVLDAAVSKYGLDRKLVKDITGLATGTNYVPQDMLAQIHEGEAVVPKKYNPAANGNNDLIRELITQMKVMSNEIKELRKEQLNGDLANVQATKTVTRILRDVTKDGTSITTTTE